MSDSKKTRVSRKILKFFGIVAACLLGLVLLLTILLLTVLEPYAERFLKKQVAEKTDGLYSLKLGDLDIDLLGTTVTLQNVHLSPDSSVHLRQRETGKASPVLLELKTPEFKVSGLNLLDLVFRKKLDIGTVFMDSPSITLLVDEQVKNQGSAGEKSKSGGLNGFVTAVAIGEIDIPGASIQQFVMGRPKKPVHQVPHLSLRLLGVELDSLEHQDILQTFTADDMQLKLQNYAFASANSVYQMGFDLLHYSSKTKILQLANGRVAADQKANAALPPDKAKRHLFDVHSPKLRMEGVDLVEAYRTKHLKMGRLILDGAELEALENPAIAPDTASFNLQQFYTQAANYLQAISIEEVLLSKANLAYRTKSKEMITQRVKQLNVNLRAVQLDSASLFAPRENLPVQEFLIRAAGYRYQHPEALYTYQVGKMELSSQKKHLQIDSLSVSADWRKNNTLKGLGKAHSWVYNLEAPSVRLTNLDLLQAFQTGILDIGSIDFQEPALDVLNVQSEPKLNVQALAQDVYTQVSGFVRELKVREIAIKQLFLTYHVQQGTVQLRHKLEKGTLTLAHLSLDSSFFYAQKLQLPLRNFTVAGQKYTYWLPDKAQAFTLGHFRYTTHAGELTASSLKLGAVAQQSGNLVPSRETSKSMVDFSAPLLHVTGLHLIKALNNGRLAIDQVTVRQPEVGITVNRDAATSSGNKQMAQKLFGLFSPITIKTIDVEDGTFTYRERRDKIIRTQLVEQISTTATGLHLSPSRLAQVGKALPLQELVVKARKYSYWSPDSVYTATLDSLHYSSLEQVLVARLFKITSDKEAHERLKTENIAKAGRNLFDASAEKFRITGFDIVRSYKTGHFALGEVVITEPEVAILQDKEVSEASAKKEPDAAEGEGAEKKPPAPETKPAPDNTQAGSEESQGAGNQALEQMADLVETFRVKRVRVEDGAFEFAILKDTLQPSQRVERVSVVVDDLKLVSLTAPGPLGMFEVEDMGILVKDYVYLTPDSLYAFRLGEARMGLKDQTLTIDSLRLEPLFKIEDYQDKLQYAADRVDLEFPKIKMHGFQLDNLFNQQKVIASNVQIESPSVELYKDNRVKQDPDRQPATLQEMLRELPWPVLIDTVLATDGEIKYSEISLYGIEPGVLTLAHTELLITNFTNDSLRLVAHPIITAQSSTRLMSEGTLRVDFKFHMDHPEDLYTYTGTLEPMPFTAFNPLFEQIMAFRMKSGRIEGADFSVRATKNLAEGQMRFLYQDLNVQWVGHGAHRKQGFVKKIGSWVINHVVVRDSNPSKIGGFREGEIEVKRKYTKSVFKHMSDSMLSGVGSSLMPNWMERVVDVLVGLPY